VPTVIKKVECAIEGNPKLKISPHYKIEKYDSIFNQSQTIDIGWMIARFFNRPRSDELWSENATIEEDET